MNKKQIRIDLPKKAADILKTLHDAGYEAYVVGGCVRDSILEREPQDWDITTNALPMEVKKLFRRTIDTGIKHGTVTIMSGSEGFEVTTYRVDGEYADHRHPKEVSFTPNLVEDLKRRDFTINAMAYNETEGLVDEFDGLGDLEKKIIRCVGDPYKRFDEDALRIMRALRFSAQLSYQIEGQTAKAAAELSGTLERISAERIRVELVKLVTSPHPEALREGYTLGMTKVFLPEFDICMECGQNNPHHCYTVGEHLLQSMRYVPENTVLRLTMLFHDIGKPATKKVDEKGIDHFIGHALRSAEMTEAIMRRLKFDTATMQRVCNFVKYHDYLMKEDPTEKKVRKALYLVGPSEFEDFLMVKEADIMSQSLYEREDKLVRLREMERLYHEITDRGDCLSLKELAVKGKDLMDAGVTPGKEIGTTLNVMLNDVLGTPSHNTKEYLLRHLANYTIKEK